MQKISIVFASILTGIFSSEISHAQTAIGKAEAIKTSVTGAKSRSIKQNSTIFENERIRANSTGLGHFRFEDGTKLVLGPGSNLTLDELVYNPSRSTFKKVVLKHVSGATRFISGDSDSSVFKIITPVGTLGLRGTAFDFQHLRGRTYLMLLQGEVEICSSSQECQTIRRKCDFVVVNTNGKISDPVQPRRGIFGGSDMERYFPFVNDQELIEPDYRLRINTCSGGRGNTGLGFGEQAPEPSVGDGGGDSGSE